MSLYSGYNANFDYGNGYTPAANAAYNNTMANAAQNTRDVINYAQNQTDQHNIDVQTHGPSSGYGTVGGYPSFGDPAPVGTYSPGGGLSSYSGTPLGGGGGGGGGGYAPQSDGGPAGTGGMSGGNDWWVEAMRNAGVPGYSDPTDLGPSYGYTPQAQPQPQPQPQPQSYLPDYTGTGYPGGTGPSTVSRDLYYDPDPGGGAAPVQFPTLVDNDPYSALRGGSGSPEVREVLGQPMISDGAGGWRPFSGVIPKGFSNPNEPYQGPPTPPDLGQPAAFPKADRLPLYNTPGGVQPPQDYATPGNLPQLPGYPDIGGGGYASTDAGDNSWWTRLMNGGGGGGAGASGGFTSAGDYGGAPDYSRSPTNNVFDNGATPVGGYTPGSARPAGNTPAGPGAFFPNSNPNIQQYPAGDSFQARDAIALELLRQQGMDIINDPRQWNQQPVFTPQGGGG